MAGKKVIRKRKDMRRVDAGDIQAIKLYFELKGKYKVGVGRSAQEEEGVTIVDDIP